MFSDTGNFGTGNQGARMKVIGVGGGGGNAVNRMIEEGLDGVESIAVNTDAQALKSSKANYHLQIGRELTNGLGAGARPEVGQAAAQEQYQEIKDLLAGADLVFITAGMGGGTGTGAAPVVARIAKELDALTIGIVTKPFPFEGAKRMRQAEQGINEMRKYVDTLVVVPNERLLTVVGKGMGFKDSLKKADEVLQQATAGISRLISEEGMINVDFADVRTIMTNGGAALMGQGRGTGENRAATAAQEAIMSPLLDAQGIRGAKGVLVNIAGGDDLSIGEVHEINDIIHDEVGEDAEIIFGAVNDESLTGEIRVTVIATGFELSQSSAPVRTGSPYASARPAARPAMAAPAAPARSAAPMTSRPASSETNRQTATTDAPARTESSEPALAGTRFNGSDNTLSEMEIPTFIRRQN